MKTKNLFSQQSPGPLIHQFFSRRNNVFLFKSEIIKTDKSVIKFYSEPESELKSTIEYENLKKLNNSGINVPKVQIRNTNYNILEYIPGILVSDLAYNLNMGSWIEKLAYWMVQIHSITAKTNKNKNEGCFLKGDCNLRNFIYYHGEIYGLDFEEKAYGDRRTDLGEICFFLLDNHSYSPKKISMTQRFLKSYEKFSGAELTNLWPFLKESALKAQERRKKWRKK
ncbi:MAG: hypothetical protein KKA38_05000 [Euryarchaeota archaeon]|nr:hypothetical protein [Euryarchaeota archaeon]